MHPPRWAEALLAALLPDDERDTILGDLAEAYRRRASRGRSRAILWYLAQSVLVPGWLLASSLGGVRVDRSDLRRSVRDLARTPGFTAVAVASLGLGIGATTAIAGALDALLLERLPVERPDELALVYHTWPERWEGGQYGSSSTDDPSDGVEVVSNVSWPAFEALRPTVAEDVDLAGYAFVRELSIVPGDGPALAAGGMLVTGEYFTTLGLATELGRPLNPADDRLGAEPVTVLSHSFWQRAFGGDASAVGSTVRLNGMPFRIVGVAQKGYVGLSPGGFFGPSDVLVPMAHHDTFLTLSGLDGPTIRIDGQMHWVRLIARIPDSIDAASVASAWTSTLRRQMVESGVFAEDDAPEMVVRLLDGSRGLDSLRRDTEGPLRILSVAVVLVLLIACANLTTLLLSRGVARSQELAVRRAIGASRWDLARPQITESLLLALLGGALGLGVAVWGGPLIVASLTRGSGNAAVSYDVDAFLVGAAVASALAAAALSAWIPALRVMRTEPGTHLGPRSRGGVAHRHRLGRILTAVQIAVSVPLLVGAGLFLATLGNLAGIDPGFEPEGLVVFRIDASLVTKEPEEQQTLYREVLSGLEALSGVHSAAIVENVLVSGFQSNGRVTIGDERPMMDWNAVSAGFFETMGIRVTSGRRLEPSDDEGSPPVVVVNETAERTLFDGRALGRRFTVGEREVEIVGVVTDTKYSSLKGEIEPGLFDPWVQRPGGLYSVHYVVRTDRPVAAFEPEIRGLVASLAPGLPVTALRAQSDELEAQAARERVFARLLTAFGAFALLLSCIGLHGLMSFAVSQRTSEMGVRLALGAAPSSIVSMILAQVARLTGVGLVLGMLVAVQVAPLVGSFLFGVEPTDPRVFAIAGAVMGGVALFAGAVPALRASRVDPLRSLEP